MFAVIFRAKIARADAEYTRTASRLRELALGEYGCLEFTSVTEGGKEIAISYWENEDQIRQWKNNAEHVLAQELGRSRWYEAYRVEIVEVRRQYGSESINQ